MIDIAIPTQAKLTVFLIFFIPSVNSVVSATESRISRELIFYFACIFQRY